MTDDPETYDALAERYHEEVLTPFLPGVDFRLGRDLRRLLRAWQADGSLGARRAVDFGCGCGEALEMVAGRIGRAAGFDFSPGMLDATEARIAHHAPERYEGAGGARWLARRLEGPAPETPSTFLVRGDLRRIDALAGQLDLALAVNSICPATRAQGERLFGNVAATLAPGGRLIAVFPSLDTIAYLFDLEQKEGAEPAWQGSIEPKEGLFVYPDGHRQKQWCPEELEAAARRAGLEIERLEKVRYPWEVAREYGYGWFPKRPRLWDWYLDASRPS